MQDNVPKDVYALGVDVGGSHLCSAVVNLTAGTLCTRPVTTPVDSHGSAQDILAAWADNVNASLDSFSGGCVSGIGFAFPGPFDYVNGISLIKGVDKYEAVFGMKVRDSILPYLKPEYRDIDMLFVNDASAFALGESLCGAARDDARVVALTLGTGVGSGFVADRVLVTDSPDVPDNGWVYCLPFEGGIVDDAFSTRWIVKRYFQLTGKTVKGAKEVAEMYQENEAARQLFAEYGSRLAEFIVPVARRFGSGSVVLGGNISNALPLFAMSLEKGIAEAGASLNVRKSQLMDHAAMIGAASLFGFSAAD